MWSKGLDHLLDHLPDKTKLVLWLTAIHCQSLILILIFKCQNDLVGHVWSTSSDPHVISNTARSKAIYAGLLCLNLTFSPLQPLYTSLSKVLSVSPYYFSYSRKLVQY